MKNLEFLTIFAIKFGKYDFKIMADLILLHQNWRNIQHTQKTPNFYSRLENVNIPKKPQISHLINLLLISIMNIPQMSRQSVWHIKGRIASRSRTRVESLIPMFSFVSHESRSLRKSLWTFITLESCRRFIKIWIIVICRGFIVIRYWRIYVLIMSKVVVMSSLKVLIVWMFFIKIIVVVRIVVFVVESYSWMAWIKLIFNNWNFGCKWIGENFLLKWWRMSLRGFCDLTWNWIRIVETENFEASFMEVVTRSELLLTCFADCVVGFG